MIELAQLDWKNLPFGFQPTDFNVRCYFRDGKWGDIEVSSSDKIEMHMAASSLHYGQEIFEGLKAFRGKDGKVRIFRMKDNAARIRSSAEGLCMPPVPEEIFCKMAEMVVKLNARFIPPYGTGASLYLRPIEIGMSATVGVRPATEYLFMIFVSPVGPYFKSGFNPTRICISRQYDRVAPKGTGRFKTAGNYAASLKSGQLAKEKGYSTMLYLDPLEKKYLDECGPANFFAVKDGKYITPKSDSILQSITNMSLQALAKDMGLEVECRHITVDELEECTEAAAIGTAAVASPIGEIDDLDTGKKYIIAKDRKPGPVTTALYNKLNDIRYGVEPDTYGWNTIVE